MNKNLKTGISASKTKPILSLLVMTLVTVLWLFLPNTIAKKNKLIEAEDNKHKLRAYLGFGLVTYCFIMSTFYITIFDYFYSSIMFGHGSFNYEPFSQFFPQVLLLSILLWKYSLLIITLPALILAFQGLKSKYKKLNTVTIFISIITLLWPLIAFFIMQFLFGPLGP